MTTTKQARHKSAWYVKGVR